MACFSAISVGQFASNAISTFTPSVDFRSSALALNSKTGFKFSVFAGKRDYVDPFDYGEDPDLEFGRLYSQGKQTASPPRPPSSDEASESGTAGFLTFPKGYNPEIASLGLYIRGDVRSCAICVSGGVYENLLFFPIIQLLKDKYPGVDIDILANDRGKQVYELNKNVRRAWVYDVDDVLVEPAEFSDMVGKLKNNCYDLVLSTRMSGLGHSMFLFLTDARQRIAYVQPNSNGAGATAFLSKAIRPKVTQLAQLGYNMYQDLTEYLSRPFSQATKAVPIIPVPPLRIGIPKKVKEVARSVVAQGSGFSPGEYVVVHGVESTSAAGMRSRGDLDSQLSAPLIAKIAAMTRDPVLVIIPNENDRAKVEAVVGPNVKVIRVTTPGQLAAVIEDSKGVLSSNTAAVQLANALGKASVALFGSEETAALFVPNAKEKNCVLVPSKTGKLADVDLKSVSLALSTFASESA